MPEAASDVETLLSSGACHLLNYALRIVLKNRSDDPIQEMAEILRSGEIQFTAEELLQFFRDVRCDGNPTLPDMLEQVLIHSSPSQLNPNDTCFPSYLEACMIAVDKLDENTLSADHTASGPALHRSSLISLASSMFLGRRELQNYPTPGSGSCHLQFLLEADPVLFCEGDALSLLVRQIYWLLEDTPAWSWSLDFVCFSEEEKKRASLVLMQRGGGDRVRVVEAPVQFGKAGEDHYVVLLDASHCVHVAVVGGYVTELLTDRTLAAITVRDMGCTLGKVAPPLAAPSGRKDSMTGAPALSKVRLDKDAVRSVGQQGVADVAAAPGCAFKASKESDVVVALLRKLTVSNHLDTMGDCWSRMVVYRGAALRQLTLSCPFQARRAMHIELAVRVLALQEKEKVGEKKKQCIIAQRETPFLPPMRGFCHSAGTPIPDVSYAEWHSMALSVSSDNKKSPVFGKYYPVFATENAFDLHVRSIIAPQGTEVPADG